MKPTPRNTVLVGDLRKKLAQLPEASVDCVITSPPYFQLRDYGIKGQMGLEPTVNSWVEELRVAMRGVARVLRPTGTLWLNLGDTYSRHPRLGAPPKSLLLGPERLGLALIEDGWVIRNKIVWAKSNTMPNSVKDRLACRWEVVYLLTRQQHYFFDLDAIREPHRSPLPRKQPEGPGGLARPKKGRPEWAGPLAGNNAGLAQMKARGLVGHPLGRNPGDVWTLSASNFRGAHFATFPAALVERPLLASCPERICSRCGCPWTRKAASRSGAVTRIGTLRPSCRCRQGWRPGVVLDPFFGAGTVGVVAEQHSRDWLGIEINPAFARLATRRIADARGRPTTSQERRRAA
jgi:site-specific DNA-methyltransferase (adenine-specific)